MSTPRSETPQDNISPHEADTLRDRSNMSPDAIRAVEDRRGFLKSAAAGIAGLGVLLKGGTASGQSTTVEDLLGPETAKDQKVIDDHNEEEEKKTAANKKVVAHAFDGLIEIAAHHGTKYAFKETIGRTFVNNAKKSATSKAKKKLGAIQKNAQNDAVETPEKDTVVDALTRLKASTENQMEDAYVWRERSKDWGTVADWLIWAAREYKGQMNPVSGEFGGQIGRALVLYQTIKTSGFIPGDKRDSRMRKAKEFGKEEAQEINERTDKSSRPVKTSIDKANKKKTDDEKVVAGNEAKILKNAEKVEADRQTDRKEGLRRQHELDLQGMKDSTELSIEQLRTTAATEQADKDREAQIASADLDRADAQRVRYEEAKREADEAELLRLATEEQARQDSFNDKRASRGKIVGADVDDPDAYQGLGLTDQQITNYIDAARKNEGKA